MPRNRSRLSVEVLEDRLVLSTFPALDGLATELLRFLPQDTASLAIPTGTSQATQSSGIAIPGFSGFGGVSSTPNATGQTDANLLGFGPVDQGIPGLTATAGPANFSQPTTATTTGQTTTSTTLTQAQAIVLAEFAAARLAAAQLLAIEAAQAAAAQTTTTPTTTTPSATLLAAEVFAVQLQAARFAAAAAQAQAAGATQTGTTQSTTGGSTSTGGGGVFSSNGSALNAFLPAGGFALAPATGATGSGVFSGIGGGTNAALPANGFPVAGTSNSTQGFTSGPSIFGTGTQTASTASSSTSSSQGGLAGFNNALAASGFGSAF